MSIAICLYSLSLAPLPLASYNPAHMETGSQPSTIRQPQFWLGIVISLLCLAAIFIFIKPADIAAALRSARYDYLALALLAFPAFAFLRAIRWQFMLNSGRTKTEGVPYNKVFHIQNIGYMLNNFLPLRLGDVTRAVLIGNVPPLSISQGISTLVVERVFDLLFMVILFPFTLAAAADLPPEIKTAVQITGTLAVVATVVLIIAANQPKLAARISAVILDRIPFLDTEAWLKRLDDLLLGLSSLTRLKDGLILIALSIIIWLPIIAGYYLAMRAANLETTLIQAAFVVCAAAFSVAAPSSPGQVGVFEAGVTLALVTILGQPEAESASFAFLYHASNYIILGLLGVIGINRTSSTFSSVIASARSFTRQKG
ncbi:MAG: lysylphosphatidylglycerol synthase transmembrane domain-containing protein [Candidatus Promineifilaceae bacterium]